MTQGGVVEFGVVAHKTGRYVTQVLHDARGGVLVLDDLSEVAAPSDREAGGVSSTGKELIEVRRVNRFFRVRVKISTVWNKTQTTPRRFWHPRACVSLLHSRRLT